MDNCIHETIQVSQFYQKLQTNQRLQGFEKMTRPQS